MNFDKLQTSQSSKVTNIRLRPFMSGFDTILNVRTDEDSGKTASGLMPFTLVTSVATTDATITSSSSTTSSNADGSTTVTSTSATPLAVVSEPTKVSLSDSVGAEEFTYTTAVGEKGEEPEDKEKEEPVKETPEVKPLDTSVSEHQSEEAQKTETVPSSSSKEQTSNNSEERGTLLIRLRKCPPTSTSNGSENTEMTFVQQEASKNDSYCWICHEGGEVLCCDKCPRVLHLRCSNLSSEPEGDEWNCPTCRGIAKKLKRSRPPNLKELLSVAVKRMMFPGTELFQMEVTEAIAPGYRDHVFFPMDLGTIKKNVEAGKYHSTKEFLADTEWILHNCIIYNGARHVLTKTAKAIVRIAKDDMKEIELCANCYKLSVLQPTDWFAVPCVPPHRVVLAKVRGYPLWPAKLLSESSDRCDVRFFGQHDRAIVSRAGIQELRGQPPPPQNRHIHWNQAMHELTKYRDSIKEMRSTLSEKDLEHFFGKQGQLANLKFQKVSSKYLDGAGGKLERSVSPHPSTGSNYEPFSPQVVEVKVNVDPDSELRSSDPMYPPISSPDSEPELKIDFDYEPEPRRKKEPKRPPHSVSPQPHKTEKSKGSFASKKNHPTGLGLAVNKSKGTIHGGGVHFAKKATSSDSPQKMLPTPTGFKPTKGAPGATLTSLVTHLAEKKRAEMNGFQDSPKKAKQTSAMILPPSSGSPISEDAQGEEVSASLKSAFSSAYPPEKTAIAVVDPENKRVRKRKQVYTGASDIPLPSKRKSTQNNSPVRPQVASTSKNTASNITYIRNTPQVKSAGLTFDDISAIWGEGGVASEGASPSVIIEPETSSDSEPEDDEQIKDAGLLETTIQHVYQAFSTKVKSIRGKSSNDMGYRYYSEKLMSAVQHVLLEMLSDYHAGPESMELKEKLKAAWPIGVGMGPALDSLRKELKKEMEAQLRMVRAAADLEREKVIAEVRRQAEEEKNLAVEEATMETKKNVWCRNCWKEALYSCCWNTHYCSEECQVQHWPEHYPEHDQHLASNTPQQPQVQPSAPPRTPSFDSSAGAGGGTSFNFPVTAAATPTAIRMGTPRVGTLGSFPSPHPTTSNAAFTFNPMFSLAPNQNTNNTGVPAITTGTLGSAGPPPLTPAPAETMTSRAGPQPIPAEITSQPINYQQLMSTGRLDQLYQAAPASSITQAAHGWTFVTTPSVLTSHASQSHPPLLQRSNQTIFYH